MRLGKFHYNVLRFIRITRIPLTAEAEVRETTAFGGQSGPIQTQSALERRVALALRNRCPRIYGADRGGSGGWIRIPPVRRPLPGR